MKIAVICQADPYSGGAASYEKAILELILRELQSDYEFVLFVPKHNHVLARSTQVPVRRYRNGVGTKAMMWMRRSLAGYSVLRRLGLRYGRLEKDMNSSGVDLAYFLSPNPMALDLVNVPMINTVWDLGHRDLPEYIEISGNRHFEEREIFYSSVLSRSAHVFVDSRFTQSQIMRFYGVAETRITVLGLVAPNLTHVPRRNHKWATTESPYIIYPAQFWPHKSHVLLLDAFSEVLNSIPDLRLVLTGSDKGNLAHVKHHILRLGIEERVEMPGFVSVETLNTMISQAAALVFPSRLGPTNLPPLEALHLGVPVVLSDAHEEELKNHPGVRAVKDYGVESWSEAIAEVVNNPPEVSRPATDTVDVVCVIRNVLDDFASKRREWANEWKGH